MLVYCGSILELLHKKAHLSNILKLLHHVLLVTWLGTNRFDCCYIGCQSHLLPGWIGLVFFHGYVGLVWILLLESRIDICSFGEHHWRLGRIEVMHKRLWQFWHRHVCPWFLVVHCICVWFTMLSFWCVISFIRGVSLLCLSQKHYICCHEFWLGIVYYAIE